MYPEAWEWMREFYSSLNATVSSGDKKDTKGHGKSQPKAKTTVNAQRALIS
jgi:hypothetical protein